jgi:hypothetical protein
VAGRRRGLSSDEVARLERRFYYEPAVTVNYQPQTRYRHEQEKRLPPPFHRDPKFMRTINVSPGPEYVVLPQHHYPYHHHAGQALRSYSLRTPKLIEVRQRR